MRPETLPLVSDFKKEYKFLWLITIDSDVTNPIRAAMSSEVSGGLSNGNIYENIDDFASKSSIEA